MAHGLGRLRNDVSATFGRVAGWDGTPSFGVFEFLNRFVKASNDKDESEGIAFYLLPDFTKGDLERELYTIMPSLQGGRSVEVSSYMELVNWLLRKYADEKSLSDQDALFHRASKEDVETKIEFNVRLRGLRRLCGYYTHRGADEEPLYAGARLGDSRRCARTQHRKYADGPPGAICPVKG